jgi:hypothetical protein
MEVLSRNKPTMLQQPIRSTRLPCEPLEAATQVANIASCDVVNADVSTLLQLLEPVGAVEERVR